MHSLVMFLATIAEHCDVWWFTSRFKARLAAFVWGWMDP